jgi:hypothetical protein
MRLRLEAGAQEVALIRKAARKLGVTVSDFLREAALRRRHRGGRKPNQSANLLPNSKKARTRLQDRRAS